LGTCIVDMLELEHSLLFFEGIPERDRKHVPLKCQ
jgi:hypothetical protein